jgi:hypothetical protein
MSTQFHRFLNGLEQRTMKVSRLAIALAIASGFSTATVFGADLRQPVTQTGFEYNSYYNTAADQPVPPAPGTAAATDAKPAEPATVPAPAAGSCASPAGPTCAADAGCNSGCTSNCDCCKMECPDAKEPWRLFECHNKNNCHDLNFRGWVNGGFMSNFNDTPSNFNGPVTFADRDEPLLNQLYLIAEKTTVASTEEGCYGWGGRLDLLYGSDYRFNISRGLSAEDDFTASWDSGRFYGLDIPQAYLEVGNKKASLKVGHFYTPLGYEGVMAPDNFFYTHAYTHQYGEPFTSTGAIGYYNANDQLSLYGGVTNGWDNFEDVYDKQSIIVGATFTASDKNSSLNTVLHYGKEEVVFGTLDTVAPLDQRSIVSNVYKRTLTDRLSYVFQTDWGYQENALNSGERAEWYGINQYLFYKYSCCTTLGIRGEWFRDDDGFRVAPGGDFANQAPVNNNPVGVGGFQGNFYNVAVGANYKPLWRPNLTIRPELRYDWYSGADGVNGTALPFDDGNDDDQFLAGFDVIYVY